MWLHEITELNLQLYFLCYKLGTEKKLGKFDLPRHQSPCSSVVRACDRCTERHGFHIISL